MLPLRGDADLIIDTSELSVRALRRRIAAYFQGDALADGPTTTVVSFGYKYGLPVDADIVLDVRFLPNPHWVDELRPLTGHDRSVREYVMAQDGTGEFLARTSHCFSAATSWRRSRASVAARAICSGCGCPAFAKRGGPT